MDYLIKCEQRYREHYDRVAQVNAEGWKRAQSRNRPLATIIARALVAMAARLAPTVDASSHTIRPLTTAQ